MTTTNLFVELVVIGVGAAIWVALLVSSLVGVQWWGSEHLQSYPVMAGGLAVIYLLGIISDRCADVAFDLFFSQPIRSQYFESKRDYQDARRIVMSSSSRLADQHEYGRTRIRIVRGWAFNSALIGICSYVLVHSRYETQPWAEATIFHCAIAAFSLSVACWWSWKTLCTTEYLKIHEHAEFLRNAQTPQLDELQTLPRRRAAPTRQDLPRPNQNRAA